MILRRSLVGLVLAAALAGCADHPERVSTGSTTDGTSTKADGSKVPAGSTTGPAETPPTFHPTRPARTAGEMIERLVRAERVLHGPVTAPAYDDAAFEAQLRYRQLARNPAWDTRVLRALPARYRAGARLQVSARRSLRSVLTTLSDQVPAWRIQRPAPARRLIRFYKEGQRTYGVPWQLLAAVNLVESTFGEVHGLSTAGAQGPMQFMPSTWAEYGNGDVTDPHDAILGAAHYLAANGADQGEAGVRRALFAYNNAQVYVDGILDYRRVLTDDPAWFAAFYRWQIVYLSTVGDLWLPIGYARTRPEPAAAYASAPEAALVPTKISEVAAYFVGVRYEMPRATSTPTTTNARIVAQRRARTDQSSLSSTPVLSVEGDLLIDVDSRTNGSAERNG